MKKARALGLAVVVCLAGTFLIPGTALATLSPTVESAPVVVDGSSSYSSAVSCVATGTCTAIGTDGSTGLWTSDEVGGLWGASTHLADPDILQNGVRISCWTQGDCISVAAVLSVGTPKYARRTGGTWSSFQQVPGTTGEVFTDLSCTQGPWCVLLTYNSSGVLASRTWTPTAGWSTASTASPPNWSAGAISCWAPGDCRLFAGDAGVSLATASMTSGTVSSWTPVGLTPATWINGVSCTSATSCLAAGFIFGGPHDVPALVRLDATTFTEATFPNLDGSLSPVSCVPGTCAFGGNVTNGGYLYDTTNGTSLPTSLTAHSDLIDLETVNCTAANACDRFGNDPSLSSTYDIATLPRLSASATDPTVVAATSSDVPIASVSGGAGTYHFEVIHGTLPPGLELDQQTGHLLGIATTAGQSTFTIRVTAPGLPSQSHDVVVRVTVSPASTPIPELPKTGAPLSLLVLGGLVLLGAGTVLRSPRRRHHA